MFFLEKERRGSPFFSLFFFRKNKEIEKEKEKEKGKGKGKETERVKGNTVHIRIKLTRSHPQLHPNSPLLSFQKEHLGLPITFY
jgi:hypothetical protein